MESSIVSDTSSLADSSALLGGVQYQALRPAGLQDLRRDRLLVACCSLEEARPPG